MKAYQKFCKQFYGNTPHALEMKRKLDIFFKVLGRHRKISSTYSKRMRIIRCVQLAKKRHINL